MKIHKKPAHYFLPPTLLFFIITVVAMNFAPVVVPSVGLPGPEPIGPYLNGNFPESAPNEEVEYQIAFPNITFNSPLTWAMHPGSDIIFVGQRDGMIYYFENEDSVLSKTP